MAVFGFQNGPVLPGFRLNRLIGFKQTPLILQFYRPAYKEDEFCDDQNNFEGCKFDGGACCGDDVNTAYCSECACLGGVTGNGASNVLIGNGYCNDELHNVECRYDGGDCCPMPDLVGDGICNDETNNGTCSFDGGDCCLSSPNSKLAKKNKVKKKPHSNFLFS